jgi:7,8-dihydro-6-hydroxymethylpterin-pyrophosphokinase
MDFYKNEILLSLEAPFYGATDLSKDFIQKIRPFCQIIKISSAYKVLNKEKSESEATIVFSLHIRSSLVVEQFLNKITQIPSSVKFKLLIYNHDVSMRPELTLPHPNLVSESILLCCAAEVMPDYVHPILKKKLGVLSLRHDFNQDAEFYLQGKTFLE